MKTICYGCFNEKMDEGRCPNCGFSMDAYTSQMNALEPGTVLNDRYIIGKVLGSGGFGITYLALDQKLRIKVAIKEYLPKALALRDVSTQTIQPHSEETRSQFRHHMVKFTEEARAIAKFNHEPGIVSVQDVVELNNTVYIIMLYVNGVSLEHYVASQGGRLKLDKTLEIMRSVMESLAKVHEVDLIHRDISPDNIYLTDDHEVKLLDFGAARYVGSDGNEDLSVILKPGFAPVEQYSSKGRQGPWTDVYAVCATIYWMLTGKKPSNAMDRLMDDDLEATRDLKVDISSYTEAVILKGLAVEPKDRFKSMDELMQALYDDDETVLLKADIHGVVQQASTSGREINNREIHRRKRNKGVLWSVAVILAAILLLVFGGLMLIPSKDSSHDAVSSQAGDTDEVYGNEEEGLTEEDTVNENAEFMDEVVIIPDIAFEELIRNEIEKYEGDLFQSDLATIRALFDNRDRSTKTAISSLEGIQHCVNLRKLYIGNNKVESLEPLGQLGHLEELDVGNNGRPYDLSPLSELSDLRLLIANDVDDKMIVQIGEYFTKLEVLDVERGSITSIEPITGLTGLKQLNIAGNNIIDYKEIRKLQNLELLDLSQIEIDDFSFLLRLWSLESLELDDQANGEHKDYDDFELLPYYLEYEYWYKQNSHELYYKKNGGKEFRKLLEFKVAGYQVSEDKSSIYATKMIEEYTEGAIVRIDLKDNVMEYITPLLEGSDTVRIKAHSFYVDEGVGMVYYASNKHLFSCKLDGTENRTYQETRGCEVGGAEGYVVELWFEGVIRYYDIQNETFLD